MQSDMVSPDMGNSDVHIKYRVSNMAFLTVLKHEQTKPSSNEDLCYECQLWNMPQAHTNSHRLIRNSVPQSDYTAAAEG